MMSASSSSSRSASDDGSDSGSDSGSGPASDGGGPVARDLREWDPRTLLRPRAFDSLLICAPRQGGKTTLVRHLYRRQVAAAARTRGFELTFVFSNSPHTLEDYRGFVPELRRRKGEEALNFVPFDERGEEVAGRIIAQQDARGENAPRVLFILDDVLGRGLKDSEFVARLFTQGRHSRVAVWLVSQVFVSGVPTVIRRNADLVILMHLRSGSEQQTVCDETIMAVLSPEDEGAVRIPGGKVPPTLQKLARGALHACTVNYGILVVDHREKDACALRSLAHYRVPSADL